MRWLLLIALVSMPDPPDYRVWDQGEIVVWPQKGRTIVYHGEGSDGAYEFRSYPRFGLAGVFVRSGGVCWRGEKEGASIAWRYEPSCAEYIRVDANIRQVIDAAN